MKTFKTYACLSLVVLGTALSAAMARAQAVVGKQAPGFHLPSVEGPTYNLEDYAGQIVVLEWTNYDCPFVRKHYVQGHMQELQKRFAGKDVVWFSICSSAPGKQGHFTIPAWKERIEKAGAKPTAVLLDPKGTVGRAYGATRTPHMFVIDPDGIVAYMGAIDDDTSANPGRVEGARNYVVEALEALLSGNAVEVTATPSYGCTVKY